LHPGIGDGEEYLRETIRQFQMINDPRIAVENLPYNPPGRVLHGSSPENIKQIIDETHCKFCFDFAHAICAANSLGRDAYDDFAKYNALQPNLYHLSDGDFSAAVDHHLHLGFGNYDIAKILKEFTLEDATIVLETKHENAITADPWIKDMQYIKELGYKMNAHEKIISKLKEHGIDYKLHSHQTLISSRDVCECHDLGFNIENVFKTLAFQICNRLILVALHGCDKIDYKKMCEFLEIKRKEIEIANTELLKNLGYAPGGISPIPITEDATVIIDSKILEYEKIICGSGSGDKSIEINSADLLNITGAAVQKIRK
jgi:Cys-tRNA(Pro) deacylase